MIAHINLSTNGVLTVSLEGNVLRYMGERLVGFQGRSTPQLLLALEVAQHITHSGAYHLSSESGKLWLLGAQAYATEAFSDSPELYAAVGRFSALVGDS